ncbi:MAG: thiamine diphosphokinase [Treponema sp.]|nr:thiamine diphosphokinase [Treponema sp.]
MTGLVFTGGKGPSPDKIRAIIRGISGKYLIAAADSGLDLAENAGLKPDWITGDMDSLSDLSRLDAYPGERVLRYPADKDYTDTELAFSLLHDKGCSAIWIIGGGGGRVDHLFGIRSLCEREIFPARWILDSADIFCVQADTGHNAPFPLRTDANAVVSILPLADGPWKASSRGLRWPLDAVQWNRGFIGVSNVTPGGEFSLEISQGRFMIIIPFGTSEKRTDTEE